MKITYSTQLIPSLKNKHLLIDTNLFRDASHNPVDFKNFFNSLKQSDITVATIDFVKYELLKGSADIKKYKEKEAFIDQIIDTTIPFTPQTLSLVYSLIQQYGLDGTATNITDLVLGATLMLYKENIFLMTRDTTDFIQRIFDLKLVVNAAHNKGIFTYGIYQYLKKD